MSRLSVSRLALVALAVVSLVALAGCGTLSDARETRASFDVNESAYTARDTVRNGSVVAFDAERDHAPDPAVLWDAHRDALANRSYAVTITEHVEDDGEFAYRTATTSTIASNHSRYLVVTHATYSDYGETTARRYANGTHVWESLAGPETDEVELRMSAGRPVSPDAANTTGRSAILTGLYETNVTDVVRVDDPDAPVDGEVYRVHANEPAYPIESVENVSLTLTVTSEGRILAYEYDRVSRNQTGVLVTTRFRVEFTAVDSSTVSRPAWVPTNESTDTNASTADHTPSGRFDVVGERNRGVRDDRPSPWSSAEPANAVSTAR